MAVKVILGQNHYNFDGAVGWTTNASPRPTLSVRNETTEVATFASWDAVMSYDPEKNS